MRNDETMDGSVYHLSLSEFDTTWFAHYTRPEKTLLLTCEDLAKSANDHLVALVPLAFHDDSTEKVLGAAQVYGGRDLKRVYNVVGVVTNLGE